MNEDAGERDLQTMVNREDWDGWYWGLAKDESRDRRITLSLRWDGQPVRNGDTGAAVLDRGRGHSRDRNQEKGKRKKDLTDIFFTL